MPSDKETPDDKLNHQLNVASAVLMLTDEGALTEPLEEDHMKQIIDAARELALTSVDLHKCIIKDGELPTWWRKK